MSTLITAYRLSKLVSAKNESVSRNARLFPSIFFLVNLFYCGYMEGYVKDDITGHYLSLFLFTESSIIALIAVSIFMRRIEEVLSKTEIFGVPSWSRLLFLLLSFVKNPSFLALWITNALFFGVIYRNSYSLIAEVVVLTTVYCIVLLLTIAVLALKLHSLSQPVVGIAILSGIVILGVVASSVVFHTNTILSAVPVLSWTVDGILSAERLEISSMIKDGFLVLCSGAVVLFLGRRYV